jgi:alpha-ketoglutarate-dependent taurine dioxygenase
MTTPMPVPQEPADGLVADGWLADLCSTGYYSGNLAERLGGSSAVTDEVLLRFARRLTALGRGLSCGPVAHVEEEPGSPYTTMSRFAVPLHNDGLYLYQPPQYLLLYCDSPGAEGGDTLIVCGDDAFRRLSPSLRRRLEHMRLRIRLGDHSVTRGLLSAHPRDGVRVLLFFDPDIATTCTLESEGREVDPNILAEVRALLATSNTHRHHWRAGGLLLIDNFKVLHGRTAFTGARVLRRIVVGSYASAM